MTHPPAVTEMPGGTGGTRFKPTRAGIINLWDYFDEEFVFGDGRLALRGHNGSGKTKALEVLFPFVLDGGLDARRLDPFSGENRTMKANLLYRGQDAEHGYVWMEFARPGEIVTLVVGLTVHKNWERARPAFYITGKRMGTDFGLLSADSRPLTAKQLTAILGREASFGDRKGAYQEAVDARLFGLGRERYAQLLDLLIALRRPMLAKDLDPGRVSDTLTAGLSPVDDELVEQAARDFENLAAVQKQHDDLAAADRAVRAFLVQYVGYLQVHTRHQIDQVNARLDAAAGHVGAIMAATSEVARAGQAQERARQAVAAAKFSAETLDARLFALTNRDAYKDHEKLTLRRTQLDKEERDLTAEQTRLARAKQTVQDLATEAQRVADRQAELSLAISRHVRDLVDAADGAGLRSDGEPVDTGSDLQVSAKALATARRTDITQVRACLTQVRDAERDRGSAEKAAGTAQQGLTDREADSRTASGRLDVARANLAAKLGTWVARWCEDERSAVITAEQADALALSLDRIGEPEAPTLSELFTALTQDRMAALIASGEQLASRDAQLARDEIRLSGEREAIAAERDDAPPASDLRPADRDGRPGAPLWQLVRFADDVAGPQAAAIEGALYGAGMLTAWVHPDPAMTVAAIADAEADVPGRAAAGGPPGRPDARRRARP